VSASASHTGRNRCLATSLAEEAVGSTVLVRVRNLECEFHYVSVSARTTYTCMMQLPAATLMDVCQLSIKTRTLNYWWSGIRDMWLSDLYFFVIFLFDFEWPRTDTQDRSRSLKVVLIKSWSHNFHNAFWDVVLWQNLEGKFLSRVSTLTRDIDIAILSVRPSVRHVPVFYGNSLKCCHILHHTVHTVAPSF